VLFTVQGRNLSNAAPLRYAWCVRANCCYVVSVDGRGQLPERERAHGPDRSASQARQRSTSILLASDLSSSLLESSSLANLVTTSLFSGYRRRSNKHQTLSSRHQINIPGALAVLSFGLCVSFTCLAADRIRLRRAYGATRLYGTYM
jgi:hypothetical protein